MKHWKKVNRKPSADFRATGVIFLVGIGSLVCYRIYNYYFPRYPPRLPSPNSSPSPNHRRPVSGDLLEDGGDMDMQDIEGRYFGPSSTVQPPQVVLEEIDSDDLDNSWPMSDHLYLMWYNADDDDDWEMDPEDLVYNLPLNVEPWMIVDYDTVMNMGLEDMWEFDFLGNVILLWDDMNEGVHGVLPDILLLACAWWYIAITRQESILDEKDDYFTQVYWF